MYKPVLFEKDILDTPKAFRLSNKNYVVWKSEKKYYCMPDRCPHRAAKLSAGRIVEKTIECPYHGWRFDKHGVCTTIPQLDSAKPIPKSCHLPILPVQMVDGILWIAEKGIRNDPIDFQYTKDRNAVVSNYYLEAPYNYYLQVENLLDPAHLHFIHDGFQGDRTKASHIVVKHMYEDDTKLYGYFEHTSNTPDIEISFLKPYVVDVSIRDKNTKTILRKNIIYVSPINDRSCNVLFRDVAFKDTLLPRNPFLKFHGEMLFQRLIE